LVEKLLEKCHLEDLVIDGKIKLKFILWKWNGKVWTGFIWLRVRAVGEFL
jgi:hypothetical protein